jgi:hypothetical protein
MKLVREKRAVIVPAVAAAVSDRIAVLPLTAAGITLPHVTSAAAAATVMAARVEAVAAVDEAGAETIATVVEITTTIGEAAVVWRGRWEIP